MDKTTMTPRKTLIPSIARVLKRPHYPLDCRCRHRFDPDAGIQVNLPDA